LFYEILVLFCCFSGLASSVVLNGGQLSAVIAQLQEVLKGVDDQVKISTAGYDTAVIAAQVFSNCICLSNICYEAL
jgi:hypothetical protein